MVNGCQTLVMRYRTVESFYVDGDEKRVPIDRCSLQDLLQMYIVPHIGGQTNDKRSQVLVDHLTQVLSEAPLPETIV